MRSGRDGLARGHVDYGAAADISTSMSPQAYMLDVLEFHGCNYSFGEEKSPLRVHPKHSIVVILGYLINGVLSLGKDHVARQVRRDGGDVLGGAVHEDGGGDAEGDGERPHLRARHEARVMADTMFMPPHRWYCGVYCRFQAF
ncbi:hypothetical protein PG996_012819 [Apiospora saccharicola]|uniref:Uncharacterized protein n=1 Tax=Apiospora saccharicola TaxID=335842 RepID=A0ABR1U3N9_9PEZI